MICVAGVDSRLVSICTPVLILTLLMVLLSTPLISLSWHGNCFLLLLLFSLLEICILPLRLLILIFIRAVAAVTHVGKSVQSVLNKKITTNAFS